MCARVALFEISGAISMKANLSAQLSKEQHIPVYFVVLFPSERLVDRPHENIF